MSVSFVERHDPAERSSDLASVLETRRSVGVLRLDAPGPTAHERQRLLTIASRVPDHGALQPWRFIVVEGAARHTLVDRLTDACSSAADQDEEAARRIIPKLTALFGHPPLVIVVVSRPDPAASKPMWEQTLSAGAACMNLIVAATALGFGANWLTGWTATHPAARPVLGLAEGESIVGIIPIGTAAEVPPDRVRPDLTKIVSAWPAG